MTQPQGKVPTISLNPLVDDIIVQRVVTERGGFTILRTEGHPQLWVSTYARAAAHAAAFGQRACVNVWYAEANEVLLLVAQHRSRETL